MDQWDDGWRGLPRRSEGQQREQATPPGDAVSEAFDPLDASDCVLDPRNGTPDPVPADPSASADEDDDDWRDAGPQPPRRASARVWKFVRQDYLSGMTAGECSRRWGVKVSTIRARAAAEGWRRADQPPPPDPEPLPLDRADAGPDARDDPDPAEAGPADYAGMARRALTRFEQALRRGAATDAATWLRLHARLLDLARLPASAPPVEPRAPGPIDQLNACVLEIESIARDAARAPADDAEAHAALKARTAAVHDRITALTGRDDPPEIDLIDSIDSLFSDPGVDPAGADPPP